MGGFELHLPNNRPGGRRDDDRRVLGGMMHVNRSGYPGGGAAPECGSTVRSPTVHSVDGRRKRTLEASPETGAADGPTASNL